MKDVLKKLQYKDYIPYKLVNLPIEVNELINLFPVYEETIKEKNKFIIIFAENSNKVDGVLDNLLNSLETGGLFWLCYPKKSSKNYKSDLDRMNCVKLIAPFNFEPVSQISINDDWSAMRFKPTDEIKIMNRSFAFSEKGKKRIEKNIQNSDEA